MIALQQGASILRVHDVKEAMECIILHKKLTESGKTLSSD
jgi:dihydropteroate synthase